MRLIELLRLAGVGCRADIATDPEIADVSDDSRQVSGGGLFICRPGPGGDGSQYIADAAGRGAVAVVTPRQLAGCPLPQVIVEDITAATGRIAHAFFGSPGDRLRVLAVTGTNGKTTVAYLVRHLLTAAGIRCGLIGTVAIYDGRLTRPSELTTPGAIELARLLASMRDNGCSAVSMESSSHALHQGRVAALRFAAAGFTNLTGDHLDYHGTMANYAAAKALLFESLSADAVAVVNGDDEWSPRMTRDCRARVVRFGIQLEPGLPRDADYLASEVRVSASSTRFVLRARGQSLRVELPLVGLHNVQNSLTALGLAVESHCVDLPDAVAALATATGAPGRLQRVAGGYARPTVLVDYAHTDDALANVLHALRPLTRGKLRVVFGCGGDRDRGKRPRMLRVAQRLAHAVYVTSDNPRTENPTAIIDDILQGRLADGETVVLVEPDRRLAISQAIRDASPDDVVLIAGKGHEKYQIVGTQRRYFDDVEEAQRAMS